MSRERRIQLLLAIYNLLASQTEEGVRLSDLEDLLKAPPEETEADIAKYPSEIHHHSALSISIFHKVNRQQLDNLLFEIERKLSQNIESAQHNIIKTLREEIVTNALGLKHEFSNQQAQHNQTLLEKIDNYTQKTRGLNAYLYGRLLEESQFVRCAISDTRNMQKENNHWSWIQMIISIVASVSLGAFFGWWLG